MRRDLALLEKQGTIQKVYGRARLKEANFSELNIQKSFIGAGGITVEKGVSDFNMHEAVTRKKIIERSKEVFVAANSSKFHRDVTISIATLDKIDYIITDSDLSRNAVNSFKKTQTTLILAN